MFMFLVVNIPTVVKVVGAIYAAVAFAAGAGYCAVNHC